MQDSNFPATASDIFQSEILPNYTYGNYNTEYNYFRAKAQANDGKPLPQNKRPPTVFILFH